MRTPSTLFLAYALSSLAGLRFGLAIWVLYFLLFTDYAGIGLLETLMMGSTLLLEVPTGVLADLVGRKKTLMAAFGALCGGYFLLAGVRDFTTLTLALLVVTLGRVCYSGTFEALVFDSLKTQGQSERYPQVIARIHSLHLAALALATVVGGFLYSVRPGLPFLAAAFAHGAGFLLVFGIEEPAVASEPLSGRAALLQSVRGFGALLAPAARGVVVPLLVVGIFLVVGEEVVDDVLAVEFGFDERELGVLFALVYLASAAAARLSSVLVSRSRGLRVRAVLALGTATALSLLASPVMGKLPGGLFVLLRYASTAAVETVGSVLINEVTDSSRRATTLSTFSLLKRLPYLVLAYGVGHLMDLWTARGFAAVLGGLFLLVLLGYGVVAWMQARKRGTRPRHADDEF